MKKNWMIISVIILIAAALAIVLGGWALSGRELDENTPPSPTPSPVATATDNMAGLPPIQTPVPTTPVMPAAPSGDLTAVTPLPAPNETIVSDEEGNQTITPNWSTDKLPNDANVVNREPETNMGGAGGGSIPTDEDGIYRGDQPAATPAPTPATSAAPSAKPSAQPSATPAPTTTQAPAQPSTTPDSSSQPPAPPADDGNHKNGEISPDGTQIWFEGFGWVDRDIPNGGEGGNDYDPNAKLSGNKVGEM